MPPARSEYGTHWSASNRCRDNWYGIIIITGNILPLENIINRVTDIGQVLSQRVLLNQKFHHGNPCNIIWSFTHLHQFPT